GESSRLFDLVSSIGSRLRGALRAPENPSAAERSASALPRNPEALRLYAEGLQRLRDFDALAARDLLSRAVAAEPDFALAHSALGRAYATLGYEENARLELQQALANSRGLTRRDQLEIEAAYRAANKEWDQAIRLCQELDRLSPEDLENGLRLAAMENNASRSREALETIRGLRRLPPPSGTDPRIDLIESRVLMRTDPKAALAAAERGLAESRTRRESLLEANALLDREVALHTLGRSEKPALEEALRIFSAAGDSGGEARAMHILGDVQLDEGDLKGARASYQRAIQSADRIGYVLEKAAAVASLSRVASLQGDSGEAERLIVEANGIWRAVPDRRQLPWGLNALGSMRLAQGKLDEAAALHREALTMCRENGDQGSYLHDGYSGLIAALAAQGRLDEASAIGEEALKRSTERGDPSWIAQHQVELGSIAFERGRLADADRLFAQALEKRIRAGENSTVPESEILIAHLRLEQREPEEATRLARKSSNEFAAAGRSADQAEADAVEAEAMLLAGRPDDARKSADSATALLDEKASADARVPVLLAHARVDSALGRPQAARSEVESAAVLARKTAWKSLVFETRLAAAEVADSHSRAAAADLAAEARGLGFERLARRADRVAARRP
ncbi:MAG TPA: tetratricopeptide repeat protein, partial [Thermoanaerobaculia bacterium]